MDAPRLAWYGVAKPVSVSAYSSRRRAPAVGAILGVAVLVGVALFVDLGRADFWDPGESRYVETVREMIVSGNWLDPTLNFIHYYDKPPGYFWMIGGAFALFGRTEWAARLPSVCAAVLTIWLTVAFAWSRVGRRAALGAGVLLATTAQFVALGRSVRMDMVLTVLTTATLVQAFRVWEQRDAPAEGPGPATWPLYACPAIGLLVKGPVAVLLPMLVIVAFLLATRTSIRWRHARPGWAAAIAVAAVVAWYAVQAVRAPDYLWAFLWQHNVGRFVGRALAGHAEPVWYYLWILPITFLPWTVFLPAALWWMQRRARRGDPLATFLASWIVMPFVFFSLSRAKLPTYLLPIFPALAVVTAAHLDRALRLAAPWARARAFRVPTTVWLAGMAAIVIGTPIGVATSYPAYGRHGAAALVLVVFPVLGWLAVRRGAWRTVPALIAIAALTTQLLFYRTGVPVVNEFSSLRGAAEVARDLPEATQVFAYKTRGHSFTYYAGRTVRRLRSPAAIAEALGRPGPTAALVKTRHLEAIRRALHEPVCILWQSPSGRTLLANVPHTDGTTPGRLEPATSTATTRSPDDPPRC
jgi:4-amino-4-deoxy-L-arabinose transferase-like glycosyltransferase